MLTWMVRQYRDIKGNLKWAMLVATWWFVVALARKLLYMVPSIPNWAVTLILLCLSVIVFIWLATSGPARLIKTVASPPLTAAVTPAAAAPAQLLPTFPSLSALYGQPPQITFSPNEFFRTAYYSPLTAEVENNIKVIAHNYQANDHEGFYSRFIGVGLTAIMHEMSWAYSFKSQMLLLMEMNRRGGLIPIADAKTYYDKAVAECPKVFANWSFDQWLEFLKREQLLIQHPTNMLEMTHRGKDFVKYLAHWGRDLSLKGC
jgi:hypothetical protein